MGDPRRTTPTPCTGGHRLVETDDRTADIGRVQVTAANVVEVASPHDAHTDVGEVRFSLVEIVDLVDGYVAAIASALGEQAPGGRASLRG